MWCLPYIDKTVTFNSVIGISLGVAIGILIAAAVLAVGFKIYRSREQVALPIPQRRHIKWIAIAAALPFAVVALMWFAERVAADLKWQSYLECVETPEHAAYEARHKQRTSAQLCHWGLEPPPVNGKCPELLPDIAEPCKIP